MTMTPDSHTRHRDESAISGEPVSLRRPGSIGLATEHRFSLHAPIREGLVTLGRFCAPPAELTTLFSASPRCLAAVSSKRRVLIYNMDAAEGAPALHTVTLEKKPTALSVAPEAFFSSSSVSSCSSSSTLSRPKSLSPAIDSADDAIHAAQRQHVLLCGSAAATVTAISVSPLGDAAVCGEQHVKDRVRAMRWFSFPKDVVCEASAACSAARSHTDTHTHVQAHKPHVSLTLIGTPCGVYGYDGAGAERWWGVTSESVTAMTVVKAWDNEATHSTTMTPTAAWALLVGSADGEIRLIMSERCVWGVTEVAAVRWLLAPICDGASDESTCATFGSVEAGTERHTARDAVAHTHTSVDDMLEEHADRSHTHSGSIYNQHTHAHTQHVHGSNEHTNNSIRSHHNTNHVVGDSNGSSLTSSGAVAVARVEHAVSLDAQGGWFVYALEDGTLGLYAGTRRRWRIRRGEGDVVVGAVLCRDPSRNDPLHAEWLLVVGWRSGVVEVRELSRGERRMCQRYTEALAAVLIENDDSFLPTCTNSSARRSNHDEEARVDTERKGSVRIFVCTATGEVHVLSVTCDDVTPSTRSTRNGASAAATDESPSPAPATKSDTYGNSMLAPDALPDAQTPLTNVAETRASRRVSVSSSAVAETRLTAHDSRRLLPVETTTIAATTTLTAVRCELRAHEASRAVELMLTLTSTHPSTDEPEETAVIHSAVLTCHSAANSSLRLANNATATATASASPIASRAFFSDSPSPTLVCALSHMSHMKHSDDDADDDDYDDEADDEDHVAESSVVGDACGLDAAGMQWAADSALSEHRDEWDDAAAAAYDKGNCLCCDCAVCVRCDGDRMHKRRHNQRWALRGGWLEGWMAWGHPFSSSYALCPIRITVPPLLALVCWQPPAALEVPTLSSWALRVVITVKGSFSPYQWEYWLRQSVMLPETMHLSCDGDSNNNNSSRDYACDRSIMGKDATVSVTLCDVRTGSRIELSCTAACLTVRSSCVQLAADVVAALALRYDSAACGGVGAGPVARIKADETNSAQLATAHTEPSFSTSITNTTNNNINNNDKSSSITSAHSAASPPGLMTQTVAGVRCECDAGGAFDALRQRLLHLDELRATLRRLGSDMADAAADLHGMLQRAHAERAVANWAAMRAAYAQVWQRHRELLSEDEKRRQGESVRRRGWAKVWGLVWCMGEMHGYVTRKQRERWGAVCGACLRVGDVDGLLELLRSGFAD